MAVNQSVRTSGKDHRIYIWTAIGSVIIVLIGFARTYYLKGYFGTPELPGLVHLHGIVMTSWVILFLAQVSLVASHRTNIHRRLGVFGGILAAIVLVVGYLTAVSGARRGSSPGPPPLEFLAVPLGELVIFACLVGAALYFRRQSNIHKRLMLLSCAAFLPAAVARIPLGFILNGGPLAFFGLPDLLLLAFIAFDTLKNRRLHPAFGWGFLLIIVSQILRLMVSGTDTWLQFAKWLVG